MSRKDIRKAIRACEDAGLVYEPQHSHPRVVDPKTGRYVSFSNTPNCPHAHKNMLKDVRKYLGIEVAI